MPFAAVARQVKKRHSENIPRLFVYFVFFDVVSKNARTKNNVDIFFYFLLFTIYKKQLDAKKHFS